jgi:hypothetical protein
MDGDIGQGFAIQRYARLFQSIHKLAVAHIALPRRSINSRNPQLPKLSLAHTTITIGIFQGLHHGFFATLEQAMLTTPLPFGQL